MTATTFKINKENGIRTLIVGAYCATSIAFLLTVPFLAFAFTGVVLINSKSFPMRIRLFLAIVMVIALSMMTGARPLLAEDSNDIDGYYYVYQMLADGDLSYLTHFGGGIETGTGGLEVGLPLLLYFLSLFLPPLSVNGLMFCLAFASSFLLLIWIEKTFYAGHNIRRPALIGASILLLNLYFSTQLTRQFFSLIILLYAFSARGWLRQWIYVAFAAAFHLTAIPLYILYRLLRTGLVGWGVVIVLMFLFRFFFLQIAGALDVLPPIIIEKLSYYIGNVEGYTSADIASLHMIMLLSSISLMVLITARIKPAPEAKTWLAVPWIAGVIHLILLPIPLASLRATLMIHSIVPGFLAYKMFDGGGPKARTLLVVVLNLLLVYKILGYMFSENSGNLFSTMHMLTNFIL